MLRRSTGNRLQLQLTPMIDCTFQLILFFLLTTQMAGQELPDLLLHEPEKPMSSALAPDAGRRSHVTVNVLTRYKAPKDERDPNFSIVADRYQVGLDMVSAGHPEAFSRLTELLRSRKSSAGGDAAEFWVEIRADRDIRYGDVESVMQAASDAGIERMSLTAVDPQDGDAGPVKGE